MNVGGTIAPDCQMSATRSTRHREFMVTAASRAESVQGFRRLDIGLDALVSARRVMSPALEADHLDCDILAGEDREPRQRRRSAKRMKTAISVHQVAARRAQRRARKQP